MLEDREYMREPQYRGRMTVTTQLVIVLVAVFALQCINDVHHFEDIEGWLALTSYGLRHGWLWQLFTFQFLHSSFLHLLFNLIGLWMFGRFVENVLGPKRYLIALFGGGAAGGLLQGVLMLAFPSHYGSGVVGASAGIATLTAIFCLLERRSEVRIYFVLPVPAIALLWMLLGISLFFTLVPTAREMGVAHAAHLGGLLVGIVWVKRGWHQDFRPLPWENWFKRGDSREQGSSRVQIQRLEARQKTKRDEKPVNDEVDAILDKISAHGIHSLTDAERKTLDAARRKMEK